MEILMQMGGVSV